MSGLMMKMQMVLSGPWQEAGQDLVEYALLMALIAFGLTSGMNSVATGVSTAFNNISAILSATLS